MGNFTKELNKALLPYKNKPILSHIIDQFTVDTRFIIPLGYNSSQIRDFCNISYADRNIEFVDVDDWTSENSGTAYTLKQCKNNINTSFWYIPCDTYFNESITVSDVDRYYVKNVPSHNSSLYTMFEIVQDNITNITFKQPAPNEWCAFTGLMYIHDWKRFFDRLAVLDSTEFIYLIKAGDKITMLDSWLDFGNPTIYQTELSKSQKFDFSKKDEITYVCNNRVVKWWSDPTVAKKKYERTLANSTVFPNNCEYINNFLAYDYSLGTTLYEHNNPKTFNKLLQWLDTAVWLEDKASIEIATLEFYKTKTLSRIANFIEKYPKLPPIKCVDGILIKDYKYYLNKIDWVDLSKNTMSVFLHGDLQFDNIIVNNSNEFTIIDWRQEFATLPIYGDIYYDLAKLSAGLIINYANIKNHNFGIDIDDENVTLSIPNIDYIDIYQSILKDYIINRGLDYNKVQQLIPIIFWNMAPLHTSPFDLFLWYLGLKLFAEHF
jgi:thiamine kinase-like enzyme